MILGVTGTNGSGKGTVVDYLEQKGFRHFSVRKYIEEEIVRRGMPIDRVSMNVVGNDMREKHGFDYWDQLFYKDLGDYAGDAVFESVRNLASAKELKSRGVVLCAVDADKKLRYERIVKRGTSTDHVTFQQFCEQEDKEMNASEVWDMNVFGVMKMSDFVIHNDGSLDELYAQVDNVLAKL